MNRVFWICLACAVVAVIFLLVAVGRSEPSRGGGDVAPHSGLSAPQVRVGSSNGAIRGKTGGEGGSRLTVGDTRSRAKPVLADSGDDGDDARTPGERSLEERIEKALEDESLDAAIACADEAFRCKVVEIRQNMVDTLGWFGAKALPELTPFLADDDVDVRESAMSEWTMALADIEDDAARIGAVESAMGILNDEDSLEELSSEYIGVDEKLAVESLVRIIEGGGSKEGVEKAKETYEFVTGDEWAGTEEAARWIAEEYEPPEK